MSDVLSLSAGGLQGAASAYERAAKSYNSLNEQLKKILEQVGANWNDEVGEEWKDKIPTIMDDFDKISQNLESNANFLNEIAQKSSETQRKAKAAVSQIM